MNKTEAERDSPVEGEVPAGGEVQGETVSEEVSPSKEVQEECPEGRLGELEKENSDLRDQYLRKQADFENYRKRVAREKAEAVKYGNQELLKDLIEVVDNFGRALVSSRESKDFNSFLEGVEMIEQQFLGMLEGKWGLKKMESLGCEYDPSSHEALTMEESEGLEVATVLEDYQTGYILHDRVVRPAKVKVGMPITSKEDNTQEEEE